jgi:hypothetical protein
MNEYLVPGIIFAVVGYFLLIFLFDLLLRGFHPFIASRPWVVDQLMPEVKLSQKRPMKALAFSSGRSGFFYSLRQKYPNIELIGYERNYFPYLVSLVQKLIRRSKISIRKSEVHRVDVSDVDFIYCHLTPDDMRGLGKKLKFECKPGAQVISTGFVIPYLNPIKVVELPDKPGRLNFLSKNQNLFQSKRKKFRKEKRAYIYEI